MKSLLRLTTITITLMVLAGSQTHTAQAARANTASLPQGRGEWPQWRKDQRLTGYQPMAGRITEPRQIWSYHIGGWQGYVVANPSGPGNSITLEGETEIDPAWCERELSYWGLAPVRHDLAGDATLASLPNPHKVGRLLDNVPGLQSVYIQPDHDKVGEEIDTGTLSVFSYEHGADNPRLAWQAPTAYKTHRPHWALADADGDGDLDIFHSDWGQLTAYDGKNGDVIRQLHWYDYRHRGTLVVKDIDGDSRAEAAVIGCFHMHVSVIDNTENGFVKLWSRLYETQIEVQDRIVRTCRNCLEDLNGDGRYELAYNLIDLTGDARWHVMIHDALTGEVLLDLPGCYLDDIQDLDGDGIHELFLSRSEALALPDYRDVMVGQLSEGDINPLWQGYGRLHQRFDERVPAHTFDEYPYYDAVTGDTNNNGLKEFFVSVPTDDHQENILALELSDRKVTRVGRIAVPTQGSTDVLAVADANGQKPPEVLIRCRLSQPHARLSSDDWDLSLASWRRGPPDSDVLTTPIVADLDDNGQPTIVLPTRWDSVLALQPPTDSASPLALWRRPGRGMRLIYRQENHGVLAADFTGDGRKNIVLGTKAPGGAAALEAVDSTGRRRWIRELPQVQYAPARGRHGSLNTWNVGKFRHDQPLDLYVSAHLNAMHSGTSYALSGQDGSPLWYRCCLFDRTREIGGGHVSIADVTGDGLDEIAGGYCNYYWLLQGATGDTLHQQHTALLFRTELPGSYIVQTTPQLIDLNGHGDFQVLFNRHPLATALTDLTTREITWFQHTRGNYLMAPIANRDSGEKMELGYFSRTQDGEDRFCCLDLVTGKVKWSIPLDMPESHSDPVAGDIDGDGRDEFIVISGKTLCAIGSQNGQGQLLWQIDLPATAASPVLADVDQDGYTEILLVTADGYLRCFQ